MSGLRKAKEYDWKDSNIEKLGSKEDRQVKKDAALTEPAWQGCESPDNFPYLRVWRVEKFEVKAWPKENYGKFCNGDSYIILHGEKIPDSEKIDYDVHFWIGKNSTQDEYGTAAYKTVELDTYLDDAPVQHREVEKCESEEFKEYFGGELTIVDGGIESGFIQVKRGDASFAFDKPMLIHYKKGKDKGEYQAVEVPRTKENFHFDDGFLVIFFEKKIIEVKGRNVKPADAYAIQRMITDLKAEYPKAEHEIVRQEDLVKHEAYQFEDEDEDDLPFVTKLIRVLTDETIQGDFKLVAEGSDIKVSLLDSSDVFLLETPKRCFVWIGKNTDSSEVRNAMSYAHKYLSQLGQKPFSGISVLKEREIVKGGKINKDFLRYMPNYKAEKEQQTNKKTFGPRGGYRK